MPFGNPRHVHVDTMNNVELDEFHPTGEDKRRSTASTAFLSNTCILDDWSMESTELKYAAVRYFHSRYIQALDGSSPTMHPLQWLTMSGKHSMQRLDMLGLIRLFPGLQKLDGTVIQACWKVFQPADVHTCLRIMAVIHADPQQFVFDWFSSASGFSMLKKKSVISKKECRLLHAALRLPADSSIDSMSLAQFSKRYTTPVLAPLLRIFDVFPSPLDERRMIQTSDDLTDCYVVSSTWWNQWVAFTCESNQTDTIHPRPSSVYNLHLLDDDGNMRRNLKLNIDFILVSPSPWNCMMELYGGGPAILYNTETSTASRLQVFLAERDGRPSTQHRYIHVRQPIAAHDIMNSLIKIFELRDVIRLWHRSMPDQIWELWNEDDILEQYVLVEMQTPLLEWPRNQLKSTRDFRPLRIGDPVDAYDCERVWRSGIVQRVSTLETNRVCIHFTGFSSIYDEWIHQDSGKIQPRNSRTNPSKYWNSIVSLNPGFLGSVGLLNLGNTCFMNCALQCLSATSLWRYYFLQKSFVKDINRQNKLGAKGKIVQAFSSLLVNIWSNKNTCTSIVSPHDFRKVFSKCKPQFDGFDQHDGHEYIASLLDAIHEDLNQPTKISTNRIVSTDDGLQAYTAWNQHIQRNQSIVVDLFHGLLRSQTICSDCSHRRLQFEPSLFLSLPIAQLNSKYNLRVWVHPIDSSPRLCQVPLHSFEGNAKLVIDIIATEMQLCPNLLRLIHIQNHRFARLISIDALICDFENAILCCFERKYASKGSPPIVDIQVVHRIDGNQLFGLPFVLSIDCEATCDDMHRAVSSMLKLYLKLPEKETMYQVRTMHSGEISGGQGIVIPFGDAPLLSYFTPPHILVLDWTTDEYISNHSSIQSILNPPSKPAVTLDHCLANFMKIEDIANDCWKCEGCHATNGGTRQMDIWRAPDILMIHLKRFHYSTVQHNKVQEVVHFPLDGLNMKPYISAPTEDPNHYLYDLYSVVNHTGGLSEGHYTAYCRHELSPPNGLHPQVQAPSHVWLNFDDEIVNEIPPQNIVTNAAYVLFYRRRVPSSSTLVRVI